MKYLLSIATLVGMIYLLVLFTEALTPVKPKSFTTIMEARIYLRKCKGRNKIQRIILNEDNSFKAICIEKQDD